MSVFPVPVLLRATACPEMGFPGASFVAKARFATDASLATTALVSLVKVDPLADTGPAVQVTEPLRLNVLATFAVTVLACALVLVN